MGTNLAGLKLTNPPHHIWEGVNWYAYARNKCREHEDNLRDNGRSV